MAQPSQPALIDGRRLRGERTRRYIIEAYLALLSESPRLATAIQIAERADYSVRSLFERFPGLLTLSVDDACAVWIRAIDGLLPPTPAVS
jgi:hypothetical protein